MTFILTSNRYTASCIPIRSTWPLPGSCWILPPPCLQKFTDLWPHEQIESFDSLSETKDEGCEQTQLSQLLKFLLSLHHKKVLSLFLRRRNCGKKKKVINFKREEIWSLEGNTSQTFLYLDVQFLLKYSALRSLFISEFTVKFISTLCFILLYGMKLIHVLGDILLIPCA